MPFLPSLRFPATFYPPIWKETVGSTICSLSIELITSAEDFYSTYRSSADSTLRAIVSGTEDVMWADLTVEQQATVLDPVVRLKGEDKWTSSTLVTLVDGK